MRSQANFPKAIIEWLKGNEINDFIIQQPTYGKAFGTCDYAKVEQNFIKETFDQNSGVPTGPNVNGFEADLDKFMSNLGRMTPDVIAAMGARGKRFLLAN